MRKLSFFVLPILCLSAAATPAVDPAAVESTIDMARAAPGEFAADAMIRVAALEQLDKARKVALLEEAFRRAAEAQEPYQRRSGINKPVGGASYFNFNRVYNQDLDGMSLRLRAIEALLPLDKSKARDLFRQIAPIHLPKLKCADFLVYDVNRYYTVLDRIAAETFTPKEVEKGEPYRLLLQQASAIASPVQVIPMAHTIVVSHLKDGDFQSVVTAYARALGNISGDDRSFSYAHSTSPHIVDLVEELKKRKLSPVALVTAYREYLVKNMTSVRCSDDDLMLNVPQYFASAAAAPTPIVDDVGYFNMAIRVPPVQTIEAGQVVPEKVEGVAEGLRACDDADCKSIADQYRALIFPPGGNPYTSVERQGSEWQAKFQDFLNAIESWKNDSSSVPEAQYFRNKCGIYSELLGMAPTPENQEKVVRAMVDFIQRSKFQAESRMQWFLPMNALLGRAALNPTGFGKLLPELRQSRDPVIALYAQLELVAPRGPEQVMPLL